MAEREVAAGEALFEIGDDGATVFVILDGTFDVTTPTLAGDDLIVGQLGPDDVVGEITAVIGGQRSATVRATSPARVLELEGPAFEKWLEENPDLAQQIAVDARRRMDRTRVARVVAELVGPGNPELVDEMTEAVDWITLEAGEALFEQGDEADAAYILVGGQMRVIATNQGQVTLDTRIGRGDLIGEMGVIEQAPRMATARAIRDCTLARIPKTTFENLTAAHPALMIPLVRKVIARVGDRGRRKAHAGNIAIVVVSPNAGRDLVETMSDEIARFGPTLHLNTERVEQFLNRRDIANATRGTAADTRLVEFLHEVDVAHRWVVLECSDADSDWTRRAVRSADRVLVVASAQPGRAERDAIAAIRSTAEATGDYDLWVAQVNPATDAHPKGSSALRKLAGAQRILHLKQGQQRSTLRVARLISGNGTGIAFSGGGARSYGQIGALRALQELGIEADAVAGTSMGSVIAGFTALVDDIDRAIAQADHEFTGIKLLDYTLPMSSLFEGKRMAERMDNVFGGLDIEDTLIPFMCLSTNLTKSVLVEHRSGDMVHALRASVSLPGVFPPVPHEGDLLVDGGVLENLPARPLREDPGIATVIAIDVAPPDGPRARSDFGLSLSGLDILKHRARRDGFSHPPLATTVIASMLVGSSQARINALDNDDIDLYISLNLSGIKLLDFDALQPAIERGYADAMPKLKAWIAEGHHATE